MSLNTFVIIPTYNESENIQTLIDEVLSLPVQVGVIVVDDNSPDGTGHMVEEMATAHPGRIHVIHREGKLGLGTAYAAGIRMALDELNASRIMTMDADFSHLPGYIPAMIGLSRERHIVIGSRYVPGGGTVKWPIWRKILSWGANTFSRIMLGLDAHDTTAGFRLYHRQVLEQVPPETILSSGYSFLVEMLFNCEKQGFLVGEVPILFEDRQRGESKISSKEIARAIGTVFRLFPKRFSKVAPVPLIPVVEDAPHRESPSQNA
ncbi:MAG: polyprenol monophosphomannose synthase [Anaerolineales bacterium]|nr:polyprenol monophosphomannose synthase [Anaerolineales bacterium]